MRETCDFYQEFVVWEITKEDGTRWYQVRDGYTDYKMADTVGGAVENADNRILEEPIVWKTNP